jgi:hypothetical protein
MTWPDWGLTALWIAAVVQTCFVVTYGLSPWWRHFVGRALFSKSASLAIILWLTVVNHYLTYDYQLQVSVVATWVVTASICFQFAALVAQRRIDRAARR